MKRKLLSLLMVCVLSALELTLTGCGEKQTQEKQPEQNAEEQTQEANVNEIYKQYILEKQYKDETADWDSEVDEYSILDLDQDGTEELVLKAGDMDFYYILICGYNKEKQEVVIISNLGSTYGGFRYIEGSNKITYTDFRPFNDAMSYGFYKIENYELVAIGSAGQDMGNYFIEEDNNRRISTEDEVRSQFDNAKYPEYQKISSLKSNISDSEEKQEGSNTNSPQTANELKVGDYTLKYGTYKGEGAFGETGGPDVSISECTIILNSDGTYNETMVDVATGKADKRNGKYSVGETRKDYTGKNVVTLMFDGNPSFEVTKNNAFSMSAGAGVELVYQGS